MSTHVGGIFTPGINKGAYQGELTCPYVIEVNGERRDCGSKAIRYVEHLGPFRLRYRCRKCGGAFQYDISNNPDAQRQNPYAPYKKGKIWNKIEQAYWDLEAKYGRQS